MIQEIIEIEEMNNREENNEKKEILMKVAAALIKKKKNSFISFKFEFVLDYFSNFLSFN